MDYKEKIFLILIMVMVLFSAPTFITEFIPRPYDWLIKLTSLSIRNIFPFLVISYLYRGNKIFKYFWIFSLLLIPQAISDCGVLWKLIEPFVSDPDKQRKIIESIIDLSISGILGIGYLFVFILSFIKLRREL